MNSPNDPLRNLVEKLRQGDSQAAGLLRQKLQPVLSRQVKRYLRVGPGSTSTDRIIGEEKQTLAIFQPDLDDHPAEYVARLTDLVFDRMSSEWARERWKNQSAPLNRLITPWDETVLV
jgi:hypothetical protein